MPKVLIIADDLTGALDTAAQFANEAVAVFVSTSTDCDFADLFRQFDVVSVNTGTRHEPAAKAGEIVRDVAMRGRAAGAELFYKKTDSTLRGNLGSELNALRIAVGNGRLAFAPASPALGRTTVGGHQFIFGQPLHQTAYANDARNPIHLSSIPHLLATQTQARVIIVSQNETEQPSNDFFRDKAIYVFDSETDLDVENVARCLAKAGLLAAVAAPAALARSFPQLLQLSRARKLREHSTGPMLTVVGSVNEVSQGQVAYATEHGFTALLVSPELLLGLAGFQSSQANDLVSQVAACLEANKPVALQTSRTAADVQAVVEAAARTGLSDSKLYERVVENLARIVRRVLDRTLVSMLTVFGGDTLLAIARECRWNGFYPRSELFPGVVHAATAPHGRTDIVSKPGGFGGNDALVKIWKAIAASGRSGADPR